MSYFDDRTDKDLSNPVHGQGTPGNDARRRSYELNDKYAGKDNTPSEENKPPEEDYSLNDDRRVKSFPRARWSPSAFSATALQSWV